jgi:type I restriction enzyme, S subunit
MTNRSAIPESWVWGTLRDVVAGVEAGKSFTCEPRPAGPTEWGVVKVSAMTWGEFRETENKAVPVDREINPKHEIRPGDILVSRANTIAYVGAPVLVHECRPKLLLSDKSLRIKPAAEIEPKWLLSVLSSPDIRRQISSRATGQQDSMRNISQQALLDVEIPIPPLAEQRRIVTALDSFLSSLDQARRLIAESLVRLEVFKESAIFDIITEAIDVSSVSAEKGYLDNLVERIVDCEHSTAKFTSLGHPCIDTTCIRPGEVIHDKIRFVSEETYLFRTRRLVPRGGDIVFAREGTVGTAVALPHTLSACLGQRVVLIRPGVDFVPKFLEHFLNSRIVRSQWRPKVLGTTAPHLNVRDIKNLEVSRPTLEVQALVVAEVEELAEGIRRSSELLQMVKLRANRLRRSVMSRAFLGQLTPGQDPNDEPASELLARIRAKREVVPKQRRVARGSRTRKELAAPPTRVTGDDYQQGELPL